MTGQKLTTLRRLAGALTTCSLAAIVGPAALAAQDDLWVDGPDAVQPAIDREFPAAAVDPMGRSIYVWEAFSAGLPRNDIYLRRFTSDGTPLADPVMVNTLTEDDQRRPRVAAAPDSSFLVVWRSEEPGPVPTDPDGHWVRSQLFDADANPVGGEQYVNTADAAVSGGDLQVDVAALTGGGYVVVWRSAAGGTDPGVGILARLVSATGVPLGNPFQVNVNESQSQHHSAVAPLGDGSFVVVWTVPGVAIRRFAANGSPIGGQLDVNASTTNGLATDVAVSRDGRIAVVWQEGGSEIRGRLYSSSLAALGDDFRVSDDLDTDPDAPRVAEYGPHGFLVVWESWTGTGSDPDDQSIESRIITGVDQFGGPQLQLNVFEDGRQHQPDIGATIFWIALAWQSGSTPMEPTDDGILGARINLCGGLFCDDFELGDTQLWSVAVTP